MFLIEEFLSLYCLYFQGMEDAESGKGLVEISASDFFTTLLLVASLVWLFVYETKEDLTLKQVNLYQGESYTEFILEIGDYGFT